MVKTKEEENKLGYVYILTNPSFKDSWVKIGKTDNMERRLNELSQATGVPLGFEKYATLKTIKYSQAESMIHKMIGMLSPATRVNPKREFFNIEPEDALAIFKTVSALLDDAIIDCTDTITDMPKSKDKLLTKDTTVKKRTPKTFYSMGLKDNDIIEFTPAPQFKAKVSGERTVMFEDKEWLLSPLMIELCKRTGDTRSIGGGFEVFRVPNDIDTLYTRWFKYNEPELYNRLFNKNKKNK